MTDTRFTQLVAASERRDAERRQPLAPRTPQDTAARFRARARDQIASLRDARRGSEGFLNMAAHVAQLKAHERSAWDLIRLYRRQANAALAEARVRGMRAA